MNQVIGKSKNKGSIIPYITVDGLKIHSANRIANDFGKYYSTLGESMAAQIIKSHYDIDHYLSKVPRNLSSLVMSLTSIEEIHSNNQMHGGGGHNSSNGNVLFRIISREHYSPMDDDPKWIPIGGAGPPCAYL